MQWGDCALNYIDVCFHVTLKCFLKKKKINQNEGANKKNNNKKRVKLNSFGFFLVGRCGSGFQRSLDACCASQ